MKTMCQRTILFIFSEVEKELEKNDRKVAPTLPSKKSRSQLTDSPDYPTEVRASAGKLRELSPLWEVGSHFSSIPV